MQVPCRQIDQLQASALALKEGECQDALRSLRVQLEAHANALESAAFTRARLIKELAKCELEIQQSGEGKARVAAEMHAVKDTLAKLGVGTRKIGSGAAPLPAAARKSGNGAASPPVAAAKSRAPRVTSAAGADLLGGDSLGGPVMSTGGLSAFTGPQPPQVMLTEEVKNANVPSERVPFVTKRAAKKARAEAEKQAEKQTVAEHEAFRLQRRNAKKERRHAELSARLLVDTCTSPAIRIQRAIRRCNARRYRAELHCQELQLQRRNLQLKSLKAVRLWRQLMGRVLRDVQGLSYLLQAASSTLKKPPPVVKAQKSRPNSLKTALQEGNWTLLRNSQHNIYKRRVLMADGQSRIQTTGSAKTPSDFRSNRNQLAKLRGKLDDGVEQSYSLNCAGEECSTALGKVEQRPFEPLTPAAARLSYDTVSPEVLIINAPFLAFQKSMVAYCRTFTQREHALDFLKAELATLQKLEANPTTFESPSPEEQRDHMALVTGRLDEKRTWLSQEMERMIEQGELTADEQRRMETKMQAKLLHEEAKQIGVSGSSLAAEKLRVKLRAVREAEPIVWPVRPKLAAKIQAHETKLAALAELESPKLPLPLSEVQKLSAKPKLLEELAEMRQESRGWFAGSEKCVSVY